MTLTRHQITTTGLDLSFVFRTIFVSAGCFLAQTKLLVIKVLAADPTPKPIPTSASEAIGEIAVPPGTTEVTAASGASIGIVFFLSNLLVILTVVAGVWSLFNILLAGLQYIGSSGDAGTHEKARTYITNSVIGLILVAITYMMGGLIGFIFFGDAGFLLNPVLPAIGNP